MIRKLGLVLWILMGTSLYAQTNVVEQPPRQPNGTNFTSSTTSGCISVPEGVYIHSMEWITTGTVSAGTIKLTGSNDQCATTTDIIAAQTATSSGDYRGTEAHYKWVQLQTENYSGTGTIRGIYIGERPQGTIIRASDGTAITAVTDPCNGAAKTVFVVNVATATTTEVANAVSGEFFYICSINLVAAAAQTIAIAEDDTDGCGSLTAGMAGGTTAATGWSFAANGGIALGNGNGTVMKTATANHYLCFITGQAAQISGTITFVSAP